MVRGFLLDEEKKKKNEQKATWRDPLLSQPVFVDGQWVRVSLKRRIYCKYNQSSGRPRRVVLLPRYPLDVFCFGSNDLVMIFLWLLKLLLVSPPSLASQTRTIGAIQGGGDSHDLLLPLLEIVSSSSPAAVPPLLVNSPFNDLPSSACTFISKPACFESFSAPYMTRGREEWVPRAARGDASNYISKFNHSRFDSLRSSASTDQWFAKERICQPVRTSTAFSQSLWPLGTSAVR